MYYIFEDWVLEDYELLYKFVLGFYILFCSLILGLFIGENRKFLVIDKILLLSFVSFIIFFAGTRGQYIGTDTNNYYELYYLKGTDISNFLEGFNVLNTDLFFDLIFLTSFFLFENFYFFLLIVALIMNLVIYNFVRKFTKKGRHGSSLLLFLMIASSFSMLSIELNIIRNGLAISFLLLGIYYIMNDNYKRSYLLFIIAFLSHRTTIIPIILIIIVLLSKKTNLKYFITLYFFVILITALGYGFHSFEFLKLSNFEDLRNLAIINDSIGYRVGFRLDFVLYNSFFLLLFLTFNKFKDKNSVFLIKFYTLCSIVFFLNFHIPHSDRFGIYSWILIPVLLYNLIIESFPTNTYLKLTIVLIFYFILNQLILF